jgi:hypothetical protein
MVKGGWEFGAEKSDQNLKNHLPCRVELDTSQYDQTAGSAPLIDLGSHETGTRKTDHCHPPLCANAGSSPLKNLLQTHVDQMTLKFSHMKAHCVYSFSAVSLRSVLATIHLGVQSAVASL